MWKYPLKYAPEHTIPHWKTKKLHTVGGGVHPPPTPSQEVFRKFGMLLGGERLNLLKTVWFAATPIFHKTPAWVLLWD